MSDKKELRKVFEDKLSEVDFPVSSKMTLAMQLSSGPSTTFEIDNLSISAMELATIASSELEFPYNDVDELVDDSIGALENEGFFEEDDYME